MILIRRQPSHYCWEIRLKCTSMNQYVSDLPLFKWKVAWNYIYSPFETIINANLSVNFGFNNFHIFVVLKYLFGWERRVRDCSTAASFCIQQIMIMIISVIKPSTYALLTIWIVSHFYIIILVINTLKYFFINFLSCSFF